MISNTLNRTDAYKTAVQIVDIGCNLPDTLIAGAHILQLSKNRFCSGQWFHAILGTLEQFEPDFPLIITDGLTDGGLCVIVFCCCFRDALILIDIENYIVF